jgi:hypothetical protein
MQPTLSSTSYGELQSNDSQRAVEFLNIWIALVIPQTILAGSQTLAGQDFKSAFGTLISLDVPLFSWLEESQRLKSLIL